MLDSYDRSQVTPPPPVSSYGGSPGLLAIHSSLYATPTPRAYDLEAGIDGNESPMSMDAQILPVGGKFFYSFFISFNSERLHTHHKPTKKKLS